MAYSQQDAIHNSMMKKDEAKKKAKVYTSEIIKGILDDMKKGLKPDLNPFFSGNIKYKDAGVPFQYTEEEKSILKKCTNDPIYFIEKYCKFRTDKGKVLVKLRDYQHDILNLMSAEKYDPELEVFVPDNRYICMMQSRQSAKCVSMFSHIETYDWHKVAKINEGLKYSFINNVWTKGTSVPAYELYYAQLRKSDRLTSYNRFIYNLYLLTDHTKNKTLNTLGKRLIKKLEDIRFIGKNKKKKILESCLGADICVHGKQDINTIMCVHRTQPYDVYELKLYDGRTIECADRHLLWSETDKMWKFASDFKLGDTISTFCYGKKKIESVTKTGRKEYMFDMSLDGDHTYFANDILSHNTTTTVAFFVWYLIFHYDKRIMIVANKGRTAKEIISKLKEVVEELPFFLKPGIVSLQKETVAFENGCMVGAATTNATSITGDSTNIVYIDECAHIPNNIADEFWKSVFPTMSSFKTAQMIVTSTPKGRNNLFFRLYDGGMKGINGFKTYRVDWWQVPGHDQQWADETRATFGEEEFAQEFELQFDVDAAKMLKAKDYQFMDKIKKKFVHIDIPALNASQCQKLYWHPDFDPTGLTYHDLLTRKFVMCVDTAEGKQVDIKGKKDSDWNVINIFEVRLMSPHKIQENMFGRTKYEIRDCVEYFQVGVYLDNDNDEEASADVLKKLVYNVLKNGEGEIDNTRILLEMNFNGKNFLNKFMDSNHWYDDLVLKFQHTKPVPGQISKRLFGFKTSGGTHGKDYFCDLSGKMISLRQIVISQDHKKPSQSTLTQLQNFGKNKKGHYEGICMHDDIAMTVMFLSRLSESDAFRDWLYDWFDRKDRDEKWNKVNMLLRLHESNDSEMSDDDFIGLYSNDEPEQMYNPYQQMYQQQYQQQYSPYYQQRYGGYPLNPHIRFR